jgi:transcriptional regulator with XRE-family HTH domain
MMFCDKLLQLRREKGLSQEQLADMLNISRQAISKWEAGGTMPELEKLMAISDIFGVSVDYLVRDNTVEREQAKTVVTTADNATVMEQLGEIKQYINKRHGYEYKSRVRLFGMPLVHINFSGDYGKPAVAKGIVAIGNIAIGAFCLGGIAIGILTLGGFSLGLLALGGLALGGAVWGGIGIGAYAVGGVAIGLYALGGVAVAAELATGGVAVGRAAIGNVAYGDYTVLTGEATRDNIRQFLLQRYPDMGEALARLISLFGK